MTHASFNLQLIKLETYGKKVVEIVIVKSETYINNNSICLLIVNSRSVHER